MLTKSFGHFALCLALSTPFLFNACSSSLKPLESRYDVTRDSDQGFIYGHLVVEDRQITRVNVEFKNSQTGKMKTYSRDFEAHLYGRREDDYALRIPAGNWDFIQADLFAGKTLDHSETNPIRFHVDNTKGNYLGTWVFLMHKGMRLEDEKKIQDGKIAETYPLTNTTHTQRALVQNQTASRTD